MDRGIFIAFEGLDRCGKSSQISKLVEYYNKNNIKVKYYVFPNRFTESGIQLDMYLNKLVDYDPYTIHTLFAENRTEFKDQIIDDLRQGYNVIVDRYTYSGNAFSAAKGIDINWCKIFDRGMPKPDITFYLDTDINITSKRQGFGKEKYENIEFQIKVKEEYEKLFDNTFVAIDGNKNIDQVFDMIIAYLSNNTNLYNNSYIDIF